MKFIILYVFLLITASASITADSFDVKNIESFDGTKISYILEGEGKPVLVFIHGWSCEKTYWEYQINEFSSTHTIVAIDLAGHGESQIKRENYTISSFGKDVAAVVKGNKLTNVILVGH